MAVGTTRGKRRLGRFVKPIRLRSGLDPKDVAREVECASQTVTRLEGGVSLPRLHLFMAILGVIGATPDERRQARQLWDVADVDAAVIERVADFPVKYQRFRLDETEAVTERTLDTVIVPGLLQTPGYAAALAVGSRLLNRSEEREQRAAAERRERQELLHRVGRPLVLHSILGEAAVRNLVGGAAVMRSQLDHLLTAATLPNVTIQVVPFEFGAYGPMSGPITLLTFPEDDEPDAAYLEYVAGLETVEDPEDAVALSTTWNEIAAAVPSPDESAETIRAVRDAV
ncbi:helix-turn-helix domain-containing protein [Solihabitans fulvus]|uniref:Helix-turn-helix domain-containing protein n=1 Tax=Solihabitans fulvus TaxID=1892852 RepID=A0A5B2WWL9_9PSEU|nr:helix-turn-helix transcriptional regulator [Solihabitans fulvus]KAA2255468.1 helix-turn-helix domain-containing protein [Solihabitans fulvus]